MISTESNFKKASKKKAVCWLTRHKEQRYRQQFWNHLCKTCRMAVLVACLACIVSFASAEFHSADTSQNSRIELGELLRVIQFFNSDRLHCEPGTEDGYAPGAGDVSCFFHSSDYGAQDWTVELAELLRIIQFFNSDGYHAARDTEDAFAPGQCALGEGEGEGEEEGEGPITKTVLLPGDVPLEMLWIPAGSFMMGRYPGEVVVDGTLQEEWEYDLPQHAVTIASGFWMGKYEITNAQWQAITRAIQLEYTGFENRLEPEVHYFNNPVNAVSWNNIQLFLAALNEYTGMDFRLPSEAEWEYACRAETTSRFYWGDDPDYTLFDDYAWRYMSEDDGLAERYQKPVGKKKPNAFGLYDMLGNVAEWCEDDWHASYTGAPTDATPWIDSPRSQKRVVRSSAFYWSLRSASRQAGGIIYPYSGFRLAKSPEPDETWHEEGETEITLTPGEMCSVEAGTFAMGDPWSEGNENELPVHNVTLSAYEIGKYEVTVKEYVDALNWAKAQGYLAPITAMEQEQVFAYGKPIIALNSHQEYVYYSGAKFIIKEKEPRPTEDLPIGNLSWHGAAAYCNWLSEYQGLEPCYDTTTWECDFSKNGYHLPTEAQWERAAAWDATTGYHYRYGTSSDSIDCNSVNCMVDGFPCDPLGLKPSPYLLPVGYYTDSVSPVGCYNMSGNLMEICNDSAYGEYSAESVTDPIGPAFNEGYVVRGGTYYADSIYARTAIRIFISKKATTDYPDLGFRIAK